MFPSAESHTEEITFALLFYGVAFVLAIAGVVGAVFLAIAAYRSLTDYSTPHWESDERSESDDGRLPK